MSVRGPTGIYWGELVGSPDGFTLTRPVGWGPAVATIQVTRAHVLDWGLKHDPKRFEGLDPTGQLGSTPAIAAALSAAAPRALAAAASLPYRADLCVSEVVNGTVEHRRLRGMFLVEARVVDAEKKPDLIELVLADVRRWWRDYGSLTLEVNLPLEIDVGVPFYVARSLRSDGTPGGTPWKLREVLQVCLAQLPGRPVITTWPESLKDRRCQPLQAFGARPLEVAQALAANYRLVFELGFTGEAAFWLPGEGTIGSQPDGLGSANTSAHDPLTGVGVFKDLVPQDTNLFSLRVGIDAPDEVVVELPPPIWTVQVDYLDPVLPVEEPDERGGPPTIKPLPVNGDLLRKLAVDNRRKVGDRVVGADGELEPDVRAAILLRAPLLTEAWPEALQSIPDRVRDLLASRGWRWWQLPYRMEERYAPILARAETGGNGERLPVLVEAWGWRAVKSIVQEQEDVGTLTADARSVEEKQLAQVTGELERVRQQIRTIDQIKAVDLQKAWAEVLAEIPDLREVDAAWRTVLETSGISVTTPIGEAALFVVEGLSRVEAARQAAAKAQALQLVLEKLGRQAPKALASILQVPNAEFLDPALVSLPALQSTEKSLLATRDALVLSLNPTKALEDSLATAVAQLGTLMQTAGADTTALVAQIESLRTQILDARADSKRRAKRPVEVTMHINLPRRPVEATWHPGRLLELAEPSGWLVNPVVSDPAETIMLPLPPRVTFGSYNLPAPQQTAGLGPGKVSENAFVQAGVDVLKQTEPAFARDLGHVVPRVESSGTVRLTFTRADKKSGKATVGPHPYRIAREGAEWQVLYPLSRPDGDTVLGIPQPIIDAASELAAAAMTEQVLPSGEFAVIGAHYVLGNGKITAVRWASVPGGVDTTLYFNSSAEPLPGLELDQAKETPEPLRFGFLLDPGEGAA